MHRNIVLSVILGTHDTRRIDRKLAFRSKPAKKMANRNSPKKSPSKKNILKQKAKAGQKAEKLDKTTVERKDNILTELGDNPDQNKAFGTLEGKTEVNMLKKTCALQT